VDQMTGGSDHFGHSKIMAARTPMAESSTAGSPAMKSLRHARRQWSRQWRAQRACLENEINSGDAAMHRDMSRACLVLPWVRGTGRNLDIRQDPCWGGPVRPRAGRTSTLKSHGRTFPAQAGAPWSPNGPQSPQSGCLVSASHAEPRSKARKDLYLDKRVGKA